MMDDLQQAYAAYQNAILHLQNPKVRATMCPPSNFAWSNWNVQEPKLWYGIGILYDRWGSHEHAEEAFSQVMQMQPDFEKANEIYFRLGIIYKQQQKYNQSLEVRFPGRRRVVEARTKLRSAVLQVYRFLASSSSHGGGHLVPDWACP
jgi:tetratricopeptide (TPR) repeat protein